MHQVFVLGFTPPHPFALHTGRGFLTWFIVRPSIWGTGSGQCLLCLVSSMSRRAGRPQEEAGLGRGFDEAPTILTQGSISCFERSLRKYINLPVPFEAFKNPHFLTTPSSRILKVSVQDEKKHQRPKLAFRLPTQELQFGLIFIKFINARHHLVVSCEARDCLEYVAYFPNA